MKKFLSFFFLALLNVSGFAQDVIVFRSGEDETQTILKKVGVSTIEHLRVDNQEGPIYEVRKRFPVRCLKDN